MLNEQILKLNGLSVEILDKLSFQSELGISLKKDLRYFERERLLKELFAMADWYDTAEILDGIALDYRIKSEDSIILKYDRYYPDHQARKVFNDILGFRAFCDNYEELMDLNIDHFRIADLSMGKARDDGYRGVHVYYQKSSIHYPVEIQFNTLYDRQINNWLHDYLYKKEYPEKIGCLLRKKYEDGLIRTENEFKEAMKHVLSDCEG